MDTIPYTTIPGCLRFKIVLYKNLKHNQKYIMCSTKRSLYVGIFKRKNKHRNTNCKTFELINKIKGPVYEHIGVDLKDIRNGCYLRIDFQKDKIQEAMELRAVNIILQRITGDETFKYL
jgi:hypothetical protein